jgi:hypothetical protein
MEAAKLRRASAFSKLGILKISAMGELSSL